MKLKQQTGITLLQKLLQHKPNEKPEDILEVVVYNIGSAAKCIHHMRNFPQDKKAYAIELKKAIADTLTQLRILCEWFEFSLNDVLELGYKDFLQMLKERFPRNSLT